MDDFIQFVTSNGELFVGMMIWIMVACVFIAGIEKIISRVFPRKVEKDYLAPASARK